MRHFVKLVAIACSVLAVGACMPAAGAAPGGPPPPGTSVAASAWTWAKAEQVPGLAALAGSGDAALTSLSCATAGNCTAGGFYQLGTPCCRSQAFVVSQVDGTWRAARTVPGIAALNQGGNAQVTAVACATAGNCAAGGYYTSGHYPGGAAMTAAFVVSQVNGTWGTAMPVPGLKSLNTGQQGAVTSISCASPGNCSAGGSFGVPHGPGCCQSVGFAVSQVNGTWGTAQALAGTTGISSISCPAPGNCSAAAGLVVSQVHGAWGAAQRVATPAGSTVGKARFAVISCGAALRCTAAGGGARMTRALVVSQVSGAWGTAQEVPGAAALTKRGASQLTALSCALPGDCTAGGYAPWTVPAGSSTREYAVPYLATQRHGRWRRVQRIPGIGTVSADGFAIITSVSCASPGNCGVAGSYSTSSYNPDGSGPGQAFVLSQADGVLGIPHDVTSALSNDGPARVSSIACPQAGRCSAVGYYWSGSQERAFVM